MKGKRRQRVALRRFFPGDDFPPRGSSATLKPAASIFCSLPPLSLFLLHPASLRLPISLHLAQPLVSRLLSSRFHPLARLLPHNLPSILPVCSPAVAASVYVCSRPSASAPLRAFDYLSCVLLRDFFVVPFSVSVYLSVAASTEKDVLAGGVSMPDTRMMDSMLPLFSSYLSFLFFFSPQRALLSLLPSALYLTVFSPFFGFLFVASFVSASFISSPMVGNVGCAIGRRENAKRRCIKDGGIAVLAACEVR